MAKSTILKKQKEVEHDFDFSEMMDSSYDEEVMAGVMSGLIEASNNQMMLAIELTKLAVEKNAAKDMKEDQELSLRASH